MASFWAAIYLFAALLVHVTDAHLGGPPKKSKPQKAALRKAPDAKAKLPLPKAPLVAETGSMPAAQVATAEAVGREVAPKTVAAIEGGGWRKAPAGIAVETESAGGASMTVATCDELGRRIMAADVSISPSSTCGVLQFTAGVPEGCECRLVRSKPAGGLCPFDCQDTGKLGCVEDPALSLGFKSLSASGPLPVLVTQPGDYREAALCTYFNVSLSSSLEGDDATAAARAAGRLRAIDMIRNADAAAEEYASMKEAGRYASMKADAPAPLAVMPLATPAPSLHPSHSEVQALPIFTHDSVPHPPPIDGLPSPPPIPAGLTPPPGYTGKLTDPRDWMAPAQFDKGAPPPLPRGVSANFPTR